MSQAPAADANYGPSILEERERTRRTSSSARPLGLLPEADVDEAQLQALRVIESYDLAAVRERLIRTGGMTQGWADEAIFEFRRYLGLRALFPEPITMLNRDIDEVWHTCILFTRLYADLCEEAFGKFLHHQPEEDPEVDRSKAWNGFEEAYRVSYGEMGPLWALSIRP